jgi:hypothetical protein
MIRQYFQRGDYILCPEILARIRTHFSNPISFFVLNSLGSFLPNFQGRYPHSFNLDLTNFILKFYFQEKVIPEQLTELYAFLSGKEGICL